MTHPRLPRDRLGALTRLGQGGQGIVYGAPNVKTTFADTMVYKEYKPHARTQVDFAALAAMPALVDTLSDHDGRQLVSIAAWPCALVETGTGPAGFVMPTIPAAFTVDLTTVKGVSRTTAEFQHLLNPTPVLAARGITLTDTQRYQLLREVATALSMLHRIGVCVGDISPKNLLFSLQPHPAVYFIDCDAMRVNGVSALPQMETPDWDVPAGEPLATAQSDTYKLGILALRLLVGDQHTRDVHTLPPTTPKLLRKLITDTLTDEPDRRPRPTAWTYLLERIIEQAQHRTPAPQPGIPPTPAATHPPEPQPVVRSRVTTDVAASLKANRQRFATGRVSGVAPKGSDWIAVVILSVVVFVVFGVIALAAATSSGGGSSQSTRDMGSARSTTRTTTPTTPTRTPTTTVSPPKTTATTPRPPSPTASVTTLSPNQYGIVYVRTASGRTTCMIDTEQVICSASPSPWKENGVVISNDGSARFQSGDFGDIERQIQTIGYHDYRAIGWTIAASTVGTRFTNDRTGHGAFVSAERVRPF